MTGKVSKSRRQHVLARLLTEHAVTSQPQLVELLAGAGVSATQATVSRDLEELGAVKVRVPGVDGQVYAIAELPKDHAVPVDHLRRVLGEWVVEVTASLNLVVVRTPPGSAHVVASALDRTGLPGVLGTVAGDDTVLVIAGEKVGGAAVAARIGELAGRH
jgi:transcriptional regulator of arginine metabolism